MPANRDTPNAIVRPPLALAAAFVVGLVLDWLVPAPLLPSHFATVILGMALFAAGLALVVWAIMTISKAGSNVETVKPTTTIVAHGPFRLTRNPIYLGMVVGLAGLAVAFNTLWIVATLVVFVLVIRYGVVAREEAYLARKFGGDYLAYKARVRRWL